MAEEAKAVDQQIPNLNPQKQFEAQAWTGEHEVRTEATRIDEHQTTPDADEKLIATSIANERRESLVNAVPAGAVISNVSHGMPVIQGLSNAPSGDMSLFVSAQSSKRFEATSWEGEHTEEHEHVLSSEVNKEFLVASSEHNDDSNELPRDTVISGIINGVPVVQGISGSEKSAATGFVRVGSYKQFQAEEWSGVHTEVEGGALPEGVAPEDVEVVYSPESTPPPTMTCEPPSFSAAPCASSDNRAPFTVEIPVKKQPNFSISIPIKFEWPFKVEIPVKKQAPFRVQIPVKHPAPFHVEIPVRQPPPFTVEVPVQKVVHQAPTSASPDVAADVAADKIRQNIPACGLTPDAEKQLSELISEMQDYAHAQQPGSVSQMEVTYSKKKSSQTVTKEYTSGGGAAPPPLERHHSQLSPAEPPTPEVATQVLKNLSSLFESVAKPGQESQSSHVKAEYSHHRKEQTITQEGEQVPSVSTKAQGYVPIVNGIYNGVPVNGGVSVQVCQKVVEKSSTSISEPQIAVCPAKPAPQATAGPQAAPPSFMPTCQPSPTSSSGLGVEMLEKLQSQLAQLGLSGDHPVSQLVQSSLQKTGAGSNVSVQYSSHRTHSTRTVTYEGQGDPDSAKSMFDETLKSLQNVGQQQQQQTSQTRQQTVQQKSTQQQQKIQQQLQQLADPAVTNQQNENVEEGYVDEQGNVIISKKVTRVVTTTKTVYDGKEQKSETSRTVHGSSSDSPGQGTPPLHSFPAAAQGEPLIRLKVNENKFQGVMDSEKHIHLYPAKEVDQAHVARSQTEKVEQYHDDLPPSPSLPPFAPKHFERGDEHSLSQQVSLSQGVTDDEARLSVRDRIKKYEQIAQTKSKGSDTTSEEAIMTSSIRSDASEIDESKLVQKPTPTIRKRTKTSDESSRESFEETEESFLKSHRLPVQEERTQKDIHTAHALPERALSSEVDESSVELVQASLSSPPSYEFGIEEIRVTSVAEARKKSFQEDITKTDVYHTQYSNLVLGGTFGEVFDIHHLQYNRVDNLNKEIVEQQQTAQQSDAVKPEIQKSKDKYFDHVDVTSLERTQERLLEPSHEDHHISGSESSEGHKYIEDLSPDQPIQDTSVAAESVSLSPDEDFVPSVEKHQYVYTDIEDTQFTTNVLRMEQLSDISEKSPSSSEPEAGQTSHRLLEEQPSLERKSFYPEPTDLGDKEDIDLQKLIFTDDTFITDDKEKQIILLQKESGLFEETKHEIHEHESPHHKNEEAIFGSTHTMLAPMLQSEAYLTHGLQRHKSNLEEIEKDEHKLNVDIEDHEVIAPDQEDQLEYIVQASPKAATFGHSNSESSDEETDEKIANEMAAKTYIHLDEEADTDLQEKTNKYSEALQLQESSLQDYSHFESFAQTSHEEMSTKRPLETEKAFPSREIDTYSALFEEKRREIEATQEDIVVEPEHSTTTLTAQQSSTESDEKDYMKSAESFDEDLQEEENEREEQQLQQELEQILKPYPLMFDIVEDFAERTVEDTFEDVMRMVYNHEIEGLGRVDRYDRPVIELHITESPSMEIYNQMYDEDKSYVSIDIIPATPRRMSSEGEETTTPDTEATVFHVINDGDGNEASSVEIIMTAQEEQKAGKPESPLQESVADTNLHYWETTVQEMKQTMEDSTRILPEKMVSVEDRSPEQTSEDEFGSDMSGKRLSDYDYQPNAESDGTSTYHSVPEKLSTDYETAVSAQDTDYASALSNVRSSSSQNFTTPPSSMSDASVTEKSEHPESESETVTGSGHESDFDGREVEGRYGTLYENLSDKEDSATIVTQISEPETVKSVRTQYENIKAQSGAQSLHLLQSPVQSDRLFTARAEEEELDYLPLHEEHPPGSEGGDELEEIPEMSESVKDLASPDDKPLSPFLEQGEEGHEYQRIGLGINLDKHRSQDSSEHMHPPELGEHMIIEEYSVEHDPMKVREEVSSQVIVSPLSSILASSSTNLSDGDALSVQVAQLIEGKQHHSPEKSVGEKFAVDSSFTESHLLQHHDAKFIEGFTAQLDIPSMLQEAASPIPTPINEAALAASTLLDRPEDGSLSIRSVDLRSGSPGSLAKEAFRVSEGSVVEPTMTSSQEADIRAFQEGISPIPMSLSKENMYLDNVTRALVKDVLPEQSSVEIFSPTDEKFTTFLNRQINDEDEMLCQYNANYPDEMIEEESRLEMELETVVEEPEFETDYQGSQKSASATNSLKRSFKQRSPDNMSEASLQEFERLEREMALRGGESSLSSSDNELMIPQKRSASANGSQGSLTEFERLERECVTTDETGAEVKASSELKPEEIMSLSDIREESETEEMSTKDDEEYDEQVDLDEAIKITVDKAGMLELSLRPREATPTGSDQEKSPETPQEESYAFIPSYEAHSVISSFSLSGLPIISTSVIVKDLSTKHRPSIQEDMHKFKITVHTPDTDLDQSHPGAHGFSQFSPTEKSAESLADKSKDIDSAERDSLIASTFSGMSAEEGSMNLSSQEAFGGHSGEIVTTYQEYDEQHDRDLITEESEESLQKIQKRESFEDTAAVHESKSGEFPYTFTTYESSQAGDDGSLEIITRTVSTKDTDPIMQTVRFTGPNSQEKLNEYIEHLRSAHEEYEEVESVDESGNLTRTIIRRIPQNQLDVDLRQHHISLHESIVHPEHGKSDAAQTDTDSMSAHSRHLSSPFSPQPEIQEDETKDTSHHV